MPLEKGPAFPHCVWGEAFPLIILVGMTGNMASKTMRNIKSHIRTNIQFVFFKAQVCSHVRADVGSSRILKWKNICVKPEIN